MRVSIGYVRQSVLQIEGELLDVVRHGDLGVVGPLPRRRAVVAVPGTVVAVVVEVAGGRRVVVLLVVVLLVGGRGTPEKNHNWLLL